MSITNERLKLAVMVLREDISLTEEELRDAITKQQNPTEEVKLKPRIYRRLELPAILGLSLRVVDRLITNQKHKGKIISHAALPTIQLSKRAVGVLESDLLKFINKNKRK